MSGGGRIRAAAAAVVLVAVLVGGYAAVVGAVGRSDVDERAARAAAREFLTGYVTPEGRVVRSDQGGDTVSEGQAYALLLAVAVDDRATFERVFDWSQRHLARPDGLWASRYQGGQVADRNPAADADLDAARALVLAGERWGEPRFTDAGLRIAAEVLELETIRIGVSGRTFPDGPKPGGDAVLSADGSERDGPQPTVNDGGGITRLLVAGPWARWDPVSLNPSYTSPRAYALLAAQSRDARWMELARSDMVMLDALTAGGAPLPPDWARVAAGRVVPSPPPSDPGGTVRYGYEATRALVRLAEDCPAPARDPDAAVAPWGHRIAARAWPVLRRAADQPGGLPTELTLSGAPAGVNSGVLGYVGAAGAAHAAGDLRGRDEMLDVAERRFHEHPSYFGGAWVALARVMLTTDLLGAC